MTELTHIAQLIDGNGHGQYGLHDINQRQHALQAAWMAGKRTATRTPPQVAAALLHDIGHMTHDLGANPAAEGVDDKHEELGHAFLCRWFGPEVTEPVRLHVAAKRYLCAAEPGYFDRLSKDSVLSLSLQGGPMSPEEVTAFRALAAIRRRRAAPPLRRGGEGEGPGNPRRSPMSCPRWRAACCPLRDHLHRLPRLPAGGTAHLRRRRRAWLRRDRSTRCTPRSPRTSPHAPVPIPCCCILGDYVDRGPDSRGVVARLSGGDPLPGVPTVNLIGNHEQTMFDALSGQGAAMTDWMIAGGREALASWGGDPDAPRATWPAAVPADHMDFLRTLALSHREGGYFFAHAGIRPGVALEAQTRQDLISIRQAFLYSEADFGVVVVHGHTPKSRAGAAPQSHRHRHRGRFRWPASPCAVLEADQVGFVQVQGEPGDF